MHVLAAGGEWERSFRIRGGARDVGMAADPDQFLRDAFGRQHKIYGAGINGAVRHAAILRGFFVLGKSDSAGGLYGGAAQGAVGGGAGENDGDGLFAAAFGEGAKEMVNGHIAAARGFARNEVQRAVFDGHVGVGGNYVNVVAENEFRRP